MSSALSVLMPVLLLTAVMVWLLRRSSRPRPRRAPPRQERLRRQFYRVIHQPRPAADATLDRLMRGLRERHPDRDEIWYLERVLADLERDRR